MTLVYPSLDLKEAWKPLFRMVQAYGWELQDVLLPKPEWTARPIMVYENRAEPLAGKRYLCLIEEPIWCGNSRQPHGFVVAGLARSLPTERQEAEGDCLTLTGNWEAELEDWVGSW